MMVNMQSDAELLIRSRQEPDAFGILYDRHVDAIYRYLIRRVSSVSVEDLVAEVFLRALEARHRARTHESGSVLPWLYGIARNVVLMQSARRAPLLLFDSAQTTDWAAVDDRLDAGAALDQLRLVLAKLPEIEREVLMLVSWEELSIAEVATALHIKPGAARTRLHRARMHAAAALSALTPSYEIQEN